MYSITVLEWQYEGDSSLDVVELFQTDKTAMASVFDFLIDERTKYDRDADWIVDRYCTFLSTGSLSNDAGASVSMTRKDVELDD